MAENQELQTQQKREVGKGEESTTPTTAFIPSADIYETENALTVVLEMPGVRRDDVDVSVEEGLLTVEGRIDFKTYEGMQPVYSEYNVGPYRRSFRISSQIDQAKISAEMRDGVIMLELPKAEAAKPRRITVG
jgi:HSP20 family molecular chaperone IbpA